ncbi:Rrf2 family transcriptional regulator [Alicyclobacillus cellulosilyticus]|uniref:Rrf2 family transcriptional regulator n=1 Tax=Alicyclobacillus cellulosilyticus TaxID=1003997 RepID=A0A917KD60_9BACL|nr:Rrf2 family transcriptional regulator [Alicyclobacillus cellulosilyticus]
MSSRGEYALRALLVLGASETEWMSIHEIAAKTAVPVKYLEQILLQLKHLGLTRSKRGTQGGYALRVPPEEIVIGQVIRSLEGPLAPMGCVSVTAYDPCPLEAHCLLRPLWLLVRETVAHVLDNTRLSDLLARRIPMEGEPAAFAGWPEGTPVARCTQVPSAADITMAETQSAIQAGRTKG